MSGFWGWEGWGALEAVGTVGALLSAVYLANQSSRDQRRREAAAVKAAMVPVASLIEVIDIMLAEVTPEDQDFWLLTWNHTFRNSRDGIEMIDLNHSPSATVVQAIVNAKAIVGSLIRYTDSESPSANDFPWLRTEVIARRVQTSNVLKTLGAELVALGGTYEQRDSKILREHIRLGETR